MWILRAPVRTTLLLQGSKLGPQGTAKGRKMENVCWVKKQKRLWCAFCEHLSGSHFCRKDLSWDSRRQPKEWKWEISDGQKTQTTFMWILRAPVRIALLPQGSKLGHQGTARGMKIENVWWVKKHKRLSCEFCARASGSHFCIKDPSWDPKGQPKEWKWKMSDG